MEHMQGLHLNIIYRHFDLPADFPVIGLLGDSWQLEHKPLSFMHFHNCLEIGCLYSGSGDYYVDNQVVHFEAPCLVLAPPNVSHNHIVDEGKVCGWKWLYVDPVQLLTQLNPHLASDISAYLRTLMGKDCVLSAKEYPRLYALMDLIVKEMEQAQPNCNAVVQSLLHALFLMLVRISHTEQSQERYANANLRRIAPVISYITDNYMNDLTVEQLAQLCHVSESHFRRLFKKILGWTPQEYLQIIRIERACALLYNEELSITEVGLRVGYPTPSCFSRQFKHIHNMSPAQWRRQMRSKENPKVAAYFDVVPPQLPHYLGVEDEENSDQEP